MNDVFVWRVWICECVRGRAAGWMLGDTWLENAPYPTLGQYKGLLHTQAHIYMHAKASTHTKVDVIWRSLLQTRQCCVVLTNSSVSLVCVWFKLSPVSHRLEAFQSLSLQGKERSQAHFRAEFSLSNWIWLFNIKIRCFVPVQSTY